ncbi:spermine synthase [Candidatus Acetothermia bacterium]|jgi:spermidine synthase|nr:spermine synthase [Candidatus Acetothermia bacterium]MCI2427374.1 spermine synthase [Candidatus Acetothermia bacterium]MCI2428711.1 spermine synthase [Candidatus Acetothermia bacterium]
MNKRLIFAVLATGFSGMVVQLLLLREFLVIFHGNDLAIGIIFANWLAVEAFGAFFIGKRIEQSRKRIGWFIALSVLFVLSAPLALYLVRIVRDLIGVLPGVGMGVSTIFYSSLLILFLPSLLHGALFVFTCKLCAQFIRDPEHDARKGASSVGQAYVWETIGHIAGAVVFTCLLILLFHSFAIVFGVGLLTIIASVALATFQSKAGKRKALAVLIPVLAIFVYLLASDGDERLHYHAIARQWPDKEVIHHQHSHYGNVAVIFRKGEYTFLTDGIPTFTTPTPDIVRVEEFIHFPMLAHPRPENVAILVGGAGGKISEILKHPLVERVDYTEVNPLLIDLVRKFPTPLTEAELGDPRVNTLHVDGRRFLELTPYQYDLIFVGISNPENLQVNRLFTAEFARIAKERLREGGILAVTLPGSLTYLSHELRNLNGVIINTLKSVFPYVHIIPGYQNIFLSSTTPDVILINATLLYERLRKRQLDLRLITRPYLEVRLAPHWLNWFLESMRGATREINHDFRPKGFFYSLTYWNAMFSPYLSDFFRWLEGLELALFAIVIAAVTAMLLALRWRITRLRRLTIPYSIATTGFSGMAFDLLLIFAFQVLFGFVFHWIGLLLAAFMGGVAGGGFVMTTLLPRIKDDRALFIKLEIAVGLFAVLLPLVILVVAPYLGNIVVFVFAQLLFLLLAFAAGALIGLKFPLANRMYLALSPNLSRTAGLIYSADLAGGWTGGIIAAVVLLPVLGLVGTSLVIVMIKASSLIMLATSFREK